MSAKKLCQPMRRRRRAKALVQGNLEELGWDGVDLLATERSGRGLDEDGRAGQGEQGAVITRRRFKAPSRQASGDRTPPPMCDGLRASHATPDRAGSVTFQTPGA